MIEHVQQTLQWFSAMLMSDEPMMAEPAATWSDDRWYMDQENRRIEKNEGVWVMSEGGAEGHLVGGNLCTLNLLQGTEYMPDLTGAIVFVEDDIEAMPSTFARDLTSLTHLPGFENVKGLLIGRFQRGVEMTRSKLHAILECNPKLKGVPIVANVDFGHTDPLMTLPTGGLARLDANLDAFSLEISW